MSEDTNSAIRLIRTPISICFSGIGSAEDDFIREFDRYSEVDSDPIGQYISKARAKGEGDDADKLTLLLIAELHKKVDELTKIIQDTHYKPIKLGLCAQIQSSGFEYFRLVESHLVPNERYYGRISLPVFPQRDMPIFFQAVDDKTARILKMHGKDVVDWDSYLVSRERQEILDAKVQL